MKKEIYETLQQCFGNFSQPDGEKPTFDDSNEFTIGTKGNGMVNAGIQSGDILTFEYTDTLLDGEIGAFVADGYEPMIKRFFHDKKHKMYILQYEDGKQAPILINDDDSSFRILGRLVLIVKRIR